MKLAFASVALAAALASSALAGTVNVNYAPSPYQGGSGGGGFLITQLSGFSGVSGGPGAGAKQFITFCIEENEYFFPGRNYRTAINTAAVNGGVSGGSPDPIDEVTAVMYRHFRDGGNFGLSGPWDSARSLGLQQAIWFEEGEIFSLPTAEAVAIHNWGLAHAVAGNFHGVRVLNMNELAGVPNYPDGIPGGRSQDFLTIVPLPQASFASVFGLGVLACVRRRVTK